ncbi:MAG: type II toxin-antitoxin system Phd/YefM family antitoxin [Candidatus Sulfotelmatobacter sp.]
MSVSDFRAHCLAIVDEVHSTRAPVLITKRGKPYIRLILAGRAPKFIGRLKGKIKIVGDIVSPITPLEDWTGDLDNLEGKSPK